jgi:hypothetical protein
MKKIVIPYQKKMKKFNQFKKIRTLLKNTKRKLLQNKMSIKMFQ